MPLFVFIICLISLSARASLPLPGMEPAQNDRVEDLLGAVAWKNLEEMELHGRLNGALPEEPWSGYSWPTYRGGLAYRYADPGFRPRADWIVNNSYLEARIGEGNPSLLSPAEKYDILVGDPTFSLTRAALLEGARVQANDGRVAAWYGICHGWAPASVALAAPARPVTLPTPSGGFVTFSAEDIRALASLLWAKGRYGYKLIGGRCEEGKAKVDRFGRPVDANCLDTNPATWHLAVVNSIGLNIPLLLDNTYEEEVWNSPVYAYRYSYRRPGQRREYQTLAEAARPLTSTDRLRKFRAPGTVSLVEVRMIATIVAGRDPAKKKEGLLPNRRLEKEYRYDLELGENGEVLGGEWLQKKRPDFLWALDPDHPVTTEGDRELKERGVGLGWEAGQPVPAAWRAPALSSASRYQPLAAIVNRLVEWSR